MNILISRHLDVTDIDKVRTEDAVPGVGGGEDDGERELEGEKAET